MQYGLIVHEKDHRQANLGDDIQALAARRFLPRVDLHLERERLDELRQEVFTIMNGWFMHQPEHFPPSPRLRALVTSIHISPATAGRMLGADSLSWFKQQQPIGCRDLHTRDLLRSHGVEAYFSGCLTLTLARAAFASSRPSSGEILLADLFYRYTPTGLLAKIKHRLHSAISRRRLTSQLLGPDMLTRTAQVSHFVGRTGVTRAQRFVMAEKLLARYAAARLVITSRLHAAIPCLAFGTPVLFVVENESDPRFSGNLELLNVLTRRQVEALAEPGVYELGGERVHWQALQNPEAHLDLRRRLIERVSDGVPR